MVLLALTPQSWVLALHLRFARFWERLGYS